MLVTFKSKAYGDILMFEENARQILDLFGKDVAQGIITPEETAHAIDALEAEIARRKVEEAREQAEREAAEEKKRQEEEEKEANGDKPPFEDRPKREPEPAPVSFSARSYTFLQMLKAARKKDQPIVWGV